MRESHVRFFELKRGEMRANAHGRSRASREPISPIFSCGLVMVSSEMRREPLTSRIYKNGAQPSASRAAFSGVLLVDSQVSRRIPLFHLKIGRSLAQFTSRGREPIASSFN